MVEGEARKGAQLSMEPKRRKKPHHGRTQGPQRGLCKRPRLKKKALVAAAATTSSEEAALPLVCFFTE